MAGKIYVAKTSAVVFLPDGDQVTLQRGITRVREGHSLLEGREDLFEELTVQYDVETARQAPAPEAKPEPVKRSTKQPESHRDTASHEGPASVGASHGGEASDDPPNQGPASDEDDPGSAQSTPEPEGNEAAAIKEANKPTPRPRRGPRKA